MHGVVQAGTSLHGLPELVQLCQHRASGSVLLCARHLSELGCFASQGKCERVEVLVACREHGPLECNGACIAPGQI